MTQVGKTGDHMFIPVWIERVHTQLMSNQEQTSSWALRRKKSVGLGALRVQNKRVPRDQAPNAP